MRLRTVPVVVLACLLSVSGCGHPGRDLSAVTRTDDVGAAYAASVAGLDGRYFGDMTMSAPGRMRQVLLLSGGPRGQMLAEWEGELAAGAARARLTHPSRLTYVDVFEHDAGDAIVPTEAYGYSLEHHPAPASTGSDGQIMAAAESALRPFGLTPTAVRVLHPLGPALLVEASTTDAASVDGRMGELEDALLSAAPGLDGMFVAVDGPHGPLFRGESAARIAEGGQWFASGFDSGIAHG